MNVSEGIILAGGVSGSLLTIFSLIGVVYIKVKKPLQGIGTLISDVKECKEFRACQSEINAEMTGTLKELKDSNLNILNQMAQSELKAHRLRIIDFVNDLDNGECKSELQQKEILDTINRYYELGGNGYVHQLETKITEHIQSCITKKGSKKK